MRRIAIAGTGIAAFMAIGGVAQASPPSEPFDNNDAVWGCSGDPGVPLPPDHCLNVKSGGNTGVIHVFEPDLRWPQEGISLDPKADSRPCPHDPASTDGTWWEVLTGVWVCHHRP